MKLALSNSIKNKGGAEAAWTPASLPDLIHWYKNSTGISTYTHAASGNNIVTQWADQKGTNHLIDTSTPANDSAYNTSHPKSDGSAIIFDHGNDQLDFTSHLSLGTYAVYIRASWTDTAFGDNVFEDEAGNNFLKIHSNNGIRHKASGNRHDFAYSSTFAGDGTKYNIGWEREDTGSTTDDQMFVFVNNVSQTQSGTGDGTQAITDTLDLEKIGDPTNEIILHEIIICDDALSSGNRALLQTYLNTI